MSNRTSKTKVVLSPISSSDDAAASLEMRHICVYVNASHSHPHTYAPFPEWQSNHPKKKCAPGKEERQDKDKEKVQIPVRTKHHWLKTEVPSSVVSSKPHCTSSLNGTASAAGNRNPTVKRIVSRACLPEQPQANTERTNASNLRLIPFLRSACRILVTIRVVFT
jgi:hypothetical protein